MGAVEKIHGKHAKEYEKALKVRQPTNLSTKRLKNSSRLMLFTDNFEPPERRTPL